MLADVVDVVVGVCRWQGRDVREASEVFAPGPASDHMSV